MRNLAKFSLTLLSAGLLAACGSSGGGDGGNSPSSTTQPTATNQSSQPSSSTPSTTANQANQPRTSTSSMTTNQSSQSNSTSSANKTSDNDDDMGDAYRIGSKEDIDLAKHANYKTELIVDGKKLPITLGSGISSGGFTSASSKTINGVHYDRFVVSGLKYSDVKFGVVNNYVFAQGNVTPDSEIPTAGKATYSVDGVLVLNGAVKTSEGNTLTADFANKTINGSVFKGWTVTNAKIDGNEFSGEVVCPKGYKGNLEGKFYGKNASEIGGAYSSTGYSGAFGGKKQ